LGFGASIGSASSISYYVDVFSATTAGQLCVGTCPNYTSATLGTGGGPTITLTLPQFNQSGNLAEGTPSAGHIFVLTDVTLGLNWAATGDVTIYNFYSTNVPFTSAQAATLMTLTANSTQVVANGVASTGPGIGICCNIINGTPIYLGQTNFSGLTGNGVNTQDTLAFAPYEGFGNNTFSASLATNSVAVSGSSTDPHSASLAYQGNGQMGAIMTLTYTYAEQAVPEPMTAALSGGALLGLGFIARFKRARKA
jgi:hypothetical protein